MTTDVATQDDEQYANEMRRWNAALSESTEVEGYSLYGGKDNDRKLDSLVGVPLIIQHVTFRQGDIIPKGQKTPRDFVSCEALIRPDHAAKFARRFVVFNDGSTGIYRTIVAALAQQHRIELPHTLPETGDANTTRYDVSFSENADTPAVFRDLHLYAPEGLTVSEYDYESESGKTKAKTWYLA